MNDHGAALTPRLEPPEALPAAIGPFLPSRTLAHGRLATVFAATHPVSGADVAIKLIKPGRAGSATAVARLLAEADHLRTLASPFVVDFHELGWHDNRPYLVMELADGGSLDARLVAGVPSDLWTAARIAQWLADALTPIHQRGLVHGDVHPANLLLTGAGGVVDPAEEPALLMSHERMLLCDLELLVDTATPGGRRTRGAPRYAAPELADETVPVTAAADVHACAAVMWAAISGRNPPLPDELADTLACLSPRWRDVFGTGLHPDPTQRPSTVGELADAVITAIDDELISSGFDPIG